MFINKTSVENVASYFTNEKKNRNSTFPGYSELTPRDFKLIRALDHSIETCGKCESNCTKVWYWNGWFRGSIERSKFWTRRDNEYVSSQYRRRYELPTGFRVEDVVPTMSSDGILTIQCPRAPIDKSSVRQIEIQKIGPVRQQCAAEADRCRVFKIIIWMSNILPLSYFTFTSTISIIKKGFIYKYIQWITGNCHKSFQC